MVVSKFDDDYLDAKHWRSQVWLNILERRCSIRRLQYCSNTDGNFLSLRAIQRHSRKNRVDPSLQDNVEIPYAWMKYIDHMGPALACNM